MENELIKQFADYHLFTLGNTDSTVTKYCGFIERLVEWCADSKKELLDLERDDLEEFSGKHAHTLGMSARTRRPLVAALRNFYTWAYEKNHIPTNPAKDLAYPKAGDPLPYPMKLKSAEKLLKEPDLSTFKGIRDATILSIMMGGGLRVSSIADLNESSLNFYIDDKKQKQLIIRVKEKGEKDNLKPMPQDVCMFIHAYRGHPDLQKIDRTIDKGDQVLFVTTRNRNVPAHEYTGENRRISADSIRDMMILYGERAGIPRNELHPHAARHLYGTELAEDDVNTLMIQSLMGHADANTAAIYTHLATKRRAEVVHKSNPLAKITTPMTPLIRKINNDQH